MLSFSYCFPNRARPDWGVFVFQRLAALARRPDVGLEVVAPVPVFPIFSRLRSRLPAAEDRVGGLVVHHPRFLYFPGVLKTLDGWLYGRGLTRWVGELCRSRCLDIFDAHFVWPDGVGVCHLARATGVPYTITLRGWLYETMKRPRMLRQCVAAMQEAAAIIGVSSHLAETAVELGVSPEKILVIPNGVDTQRFFPRDKREARRELGLPVDGRLVVTVAHLGPRKGHSETIGAMADLPEDVRLVLVGSDTQGRGKNERALRELIHRLDLDGRVMLAGRQPYERIPMYFSAADLSVLASYREGCPNVVLESLACGTPVVVSRVGSVADMIDDGRNGKLVPPRQVEPLAQAMRELLDQPPSPQQVRRSPAVRSWDDVAGEVYGVLRRAAGQGRVPSGWQQPTEHVTAEI